MSHFAAYFDILGTKDLVSHGEFRDLHALDFAGAVRRLRTSRSVWTACGSPPLFPPDNFDETRDCAQSPSRNPPPREERNHCRHPIALNPPAPSGTRSSPLFKVAKCDLDSSSHPVTNCDWFTESPRTCFGAEN